MQIQAPYPTPLNLLGRYKHFNSLHASNFSTDAASVGYVNKGGRMGCGSSTDVRARENIVHRRVQSLKRSLLDRNVADLRRVENVMRSNLREIVGATKSRDLFHLQEEVSSVITKCCVKYPFLEEKLGALIVTTLNTFKSQEEAVEYIPLAKPRPKNDLLPLEAGQ